MSDRRATAAFSRTDSVHPQWVDYNAHMADFAYAIAFSHTVTAFMDAIGLDERYRAATTATLYTLDMRIGYQRECHQDDALELTLHVLGADSKRMHLYLEMHDSAGNLLAWNEQMLLHVARASGKPKAAAFLDGTRNQLAKAEILGASLLPLPHIERRIGLRK